MTETFYDRLGLPADAATEEIEAAYREAIKQVHPDVSDDVDAGERTKRLNEAKRVLTDESERARYDRLGHAEYTAKRAQSGATDGQPESGDSPTSGQHSPGRSTATGSRNRDRRASGANRRRSSGRRATRDETGDGRRGQANRDGATDRKRRRRGAGDSGHTGASRGSERQRGGGTTRSRPDSTGPTWQNGAAGSRTDTSEPDGDGGVEGATAGARSPTGARQAAARETDGATLEWSWNAWESTGAWAVRHGTDGQGLRPSRLVPTEQSMVLLGSIFFLYPFFVGASLYPPFPLAARLAVAVCTLLTLAYLLSIPEAAVTVFGLWSVIAPVVLLVFPGVGLLSLAGVVGLTATWVPLGLSVLTFSLVRP